MPVVSIAVRDHVYDKMISNVEQVIEISERCVEAVAVIVAGGGVWWSGAGEELRAFVEATRIPFYSRNMARGIIPDDHPLSGGMFPAAGRVKESYLVATGVGP